MKTGDDCFDTANIERTDGSPCPSPFCRATGETVVRGPAAGWWASENQFWRLQNRGAFDLFACPEARLVVTGGFCDGSWSGAPDASDVGRIPSAESR